MVLNVVVGISEININDRDMTNVVYIEAKMKEIIEKVEIIVVKNG